MEVFQQPEKENGNTGFPSKGNQGLSARRSQLRPVKNINVPKTQRKVLGNVNQNYSTKPALTKARKQDGLVLPRHEKTYPEIETFTPYHPLEYERFEVPEEHKLSDRCLAGVSLFVSLDNVKRFDALINRTLSPMESSSITYDSCETFSVLLEEITIDFPPLCDF
ncbi:securin-like isoform X2 [Pseudophryne corroboree]|uniref:securin-like isoform X2 n=1 Tax=Pseudophryne corroboree TaxID=495146 RepID=UPI003081AD53